MAQWGGAMEDVVNPWRGRRVFLTGHTGFKGGWLSLWLASMEARIRGFALDPLTENNFFTAASVAGLVEDIRGDVRNYADLEAAITEFAPEVVFHLAAQPLVRRSYVDPLGTYATNVMGTAHVLECIRKTPSVLAAVVVTTDKCYQNRNWVWPYRESDPLGGFDPYASSKACAEILTAAFRDSFFPVSRLQQHHVAVATARAGNVIGGGDWSQDRLVPDLIQGFRARRPVLIRNPDSIRPWQHVLEPLHGYLLLAEQLLAGREQFACAFNFGPGEDDAWRVRQIANKLASLWGDQATWTNDSVAGVHEDHCLRLDSSKARSELHWQPKLDVETALEWTVAWFKAWLKGSDMRQESLMQISAYRALLGEAAPAASLR
jgi:CDP-glucose 4,6-dehydratase